MNEVDWLTGADPAAMLDHLAGRACGRKLRLFACACVRRAWPLLRYAPPRRAVEAAERYADGQATGRELGEARGRAEAAAEGAPEFEAFAYLAAAACPAEDAQEAARAAAENMRLNAVRQAAYELAPGEDEAPAVARASAEERAALCELLRELFGNPFRPTAIDPGWLRHGGGAAGHVAQLAYDKSQFEDLPYLADALEDAGCADEGLLRHLRRPGGHVRGCWALDAVTGRG